MLPECPRAAIGVALDRPSPGHFAIRLGRRRPWMPALIYLPCPWVEPMPFEDYPPPEDWCEPIGKPTGPLRARVGEKDIEDAKLVIHVWQGARAVTVAEYRYLAARRAHARKYEPDSALGQPIDLSILRNRDLL
jgi:hypothetical protein